MYETNPIPFPLTYETTKFPALDDRMETLSHYRNEALAAHKLAQNRMLKRITAKFTPFEPGTRVWLEAKNLNMGYNKKITTKREGPFRIIEARGPLTYVLDLPPRWKIHNVFHATLLTPYQETAEHGPNDERLAPDLVEGEEEYKVESILQHCR